MAEITTIAELGTAGGTLILAIATFGATRSANRSARVAERSLTLGLRPTLVPSRPQDPPEEVDFVDGRIQVPGGSAVVKHKNDTVFMAVALRNIGAGPAVIDGWYMNNRRPGRDDPHAAPDLFRRQGRDLYVPPGDTGFWQGALREPAEPMHREITGALSEDAHLSLEILYSDQEGGQSFISRFSLRHQEDGEWLVAVGRHWTLEAPVGSRSSS